MAAMLLSCGESQEPPGRTLGQPAESPQLPLPQSEPRAADDEPDRADIEPGQGAKLASIAVRTWVYQQPDGLSLKLGYLRAGAVVERGRLPAGTQGCAGGWYRIVPRGYVCVGKGASLDLSHPTVAAALRDLCNAAFLLKADIRIRLTQPIFSTHAV